MLAIGFRQSPKYPWNFFLHTVYEQIFVKVGSTDVIKYWELDGRLPVLVELFNTPADRRYAHVLGCYAYQRMHALGVDVPSTSYNSWISEQPETLSEPP